ncbi:aminotransferase class V-fold PLP-dependent enzyme [Chloroflexi bacterium TSY]|nr:aminotransferase class V-fold PLP-dependent enzyme [Chloroflexi bacterium TSY]
MRDLLQKTQQLATRYVDSLDMRPVAPSSNTLEQLARFDRPLPEEPMEPAAVVELLDEVGSPATVATAGPRYFGFVTGGSLPAAVAANWLATAWDQPSSLAVSSPVGAKLEEVVLGWLVQLFGLPPETVGGLVTGATMANFTALAAARHALLSRQGWDVQADGLFDAPPITVVVGDEVHVSLLKALSLLGLGRRRILRVPVDDQGRMRADALPTLSDSTIVCLQAGNVNTGAFDPATEICEAARSAKAWTHVDGAFGLWAAASPEMQSLVQGVSQADSWATDAHKWLNVPYESGIVFCRDDEAIRAAMSVNAAYLATGDQREPSHYTPEFSRRARGVDIWAAMLSLGHSGIADLVERTCRHARRFAEGLSNAGYKILNDVVLNQVLVSFGDADRTLHVIAAIQKEGTCWAGSTVWQEQTAMRISVSSWATAEADVEKSLDAIIQIAERL